MYTYKDYFPRRILRECGISPEMTFGTAALKATSEESRVGEIKKSMSEVYSVFSSAVNKNGLGAKWLTDANIDRRILSAFYDMDVLQEKDRAAFPEGYKIGENTAENSIENTIDLAAQEESDRVAIEVLETEDKEETELSPKADDMAAEAERSKSL